MKFLLISFAFVACCCCFCFVEVQSFALNSTSPIDESTVVNSSEDDENDDDEQQSSQVALVNLTEGPNGLGGENGLKNDSAVAKLFQWVHCTVEKAKPWVVELEKEAKRLESTAKRLGTSVLGRLNHMMEALVGEVHGNSESPATTPATTTERATVTIASTALPPPSIESELLNEIGSDYACPFGFTTNTDGICERISE